MLGSRLAQHLGPQPEAPEAPHGHHDPSNTLVPVTPVFTNTERLALAGFVAGYSGLTRQAYELGAVAGSLGSIAAVSALGVPGLSAAGISSGLAAAGATFGGGMAAGTMAVVAAPAVAAAVVGYLMYRLALWWLASSTQPAVASGPLPVR